LLEDPIYNDGKKKPVYFYQAREEKDIFIYLYFNKLSLELDPLIGKTITTIGKLFDQGRHNRS